MKVRVVFTAASMSSTTIGLSLFVTVSAKTQLVRTIKIKFYSLTVICSVQGMDHQRFSLLWCVVLKLQC